MKAECCVFYAEMPMQIGGESLVPKERMQEIEGCKNEAVRREKYYVWKLLEIALKKALNLNIANLKFTKLDTGKWICEDCFFSLSHTDGALAVSVSLHPTGVDIEKIQPLKEGIERKILTEKELSVCSSLEEGKRSEYILECWCKKEAIFKMGEGSALLPKNTEADEYSVRAEKLVLGGSKYLLAAVSECDIELCKIEM